MDRVPRQRRALDAARELPNTRKDGELVEPPRHLPIGSVLGEHGAEPAERLLGRAHRLALESRRHHRGRGLGDGAARALKANVADDPVFERAFHRHAVAAEGVIALCSPSRARQRAEVSRLPVVVENDLLVELAKVGDQPKTSRTLPSPSMSRSISSYVL